MRKLLTLGVTAILAIAFAVGATTAFAGGNDGGGGGGGGGGGEKGEKGNACPPPTPGHPDIPPPGCGHERDDGDGNGNGNGNGGNGDGAACTAAGHPPVEEFGPISGPLHDNIGDEFPEPLGGSAHFALCALANLGL